MVNICFVENFMLLTQSAQLLTYLLDYKTNVTVILLRNKVIFINKEVNSARYNNNKNSLMHTRNTSESLNHSTKMHADLNNTYCMTIHTKCANI